MKSVLPLIIIESAGDEAESFVTKLMLNRLEAFAIYHNLLTDSLISKFPDLPDHSEIANFVMETLFCWNDYGTNATCPCACHPSLPNSELHAHGFECPCMQGLDYLVPITNKPDQSCYPVACSTNGSAEYRVSA